MKTLRPITITMKLEISEFSQATVALENEMYRNLDRAGHDPSNANWDRAVQNLRSFLRKLDKAYDESPEVIEESRLRQEANVNERMN